MLLKETVLNINSTNLNGKQHSPEFNAQFIFLFLLHLVGHFYKICIMMHGSMNVKFTTHYRHHYFSSSKWQIKLLTTQTHQDSSQGYKRCDYSEEYWPVCYEGPPLVATPNIPYPASLGTIVEQLAQSLHQHVPVDQINKAHVYRL
jgi:hypothetical protein